MSDVRSAYDEWSHTYDTMENKTRDLELIAGKEVIGHDSFSHIIEIGCGTGKNTSWLQAQCNLLTAVDFSVEMMAKARQKIQSSHVRFCEADITHPWKLPVEPAQLITFSLVLEHVEDLGFIFGEAVRYLSGGGLIYVCELHPCKQYIGSKARFESAAGTNVLPCFVHHLSDYISAATHNDLQLLQLNEWFDLENTDAPPRLISFLFMKRST